MDLVAFIGKDKENLGQVTALVNKIECDKILLIKDKTTPKPLFNSEKITFIDVDTTKTLIDLKEEMKTKLKEKLNSEFEVALSIAAGTGKDHMALISALLSAPVGIKIVAYTKKGVEFLT